MHIVFDAVRTAARTGKPLTVFDFCLAATIIISTNPLVGIVLRLEELKVYVPVFRTALAIRHAVLGAVESASLLKIWLYTSSIPTLSTEPGESHSIVTPVDFRIVSALVSGALIANRFKLEIVSMYVGNQPVPVKFQMWFAPPHETEKLPA